MRIRLPHELHAKLVKASEYFDLDQSQIVRMALRKARRVGVVTNKNHKHTTRQNSECYRFDVPDWMYDDKTHSQVRDVIEWYLDLPNNSTSRPKPKLDIEKAAYEVVP